MSSTIRTPDQRVRVFISSTIVELAEERKAAREAIEKLHLIPVFFEAGARPHPPRDLYRAYLEQSHIFIGIYWNKYGWVAPGMDISGLEDEYVLSDGKARLIYVKKSTGDREPRLQDLLKTIEQKGTVCYQHFSTADELKELLSNDLSLLLSEHFQTQQEEVNITTSDKRTPLPASRGVLIGREKDIQSITHLLLTPEVSLVNITGAGGTGKTRLGIHVANELASQFEDGVFFIPLSTLHDPGALVPFLTMHIGLYDSGKQDLKQALIQYLYDKKALLLLDNFEHLVSAANEIAEILSLCRHLKALVTSRTPLHISAEYVYPLMPLSVMQEITGLKEEDPSRIPAVHLFITRAKEINPALPMDKENLGAMVHICRKLNGIPLAIELAAARTRLLPPTALLKRMSKMLDTLVHGRLDLPERHKTLRATIDWSYNLLDEKGKTIFRRLAVFSGNWNLDDAESSVNWEHYDILDILEKLMDVSLIQCSYKDGDSTFSMFETVREFAQEQLELFHESDKVKKAHLEYHIHLLEETMPYTYTAQRVFWFKRLERESPHLRDAFDYAIQLSDYTSAWTIIRSLGFYWSFYGKITEAVQWIEQARVTADEAISGNIRKDIPKDIQAGALRSSGMVHFFASSFQSAVNDLKESIRIYLDLGDELEAGRAMSYGGVASISMGDFQASSNFVRAIEIGKKFNDKHNIIISSAFLSEVLVSMNDLEKASALVSEALEISRQHDDALLIALALGQTGNINLIRGDYLAAEKVYKESLSYSDQMPLGSMKGWFEIGLAYCYLSLDDKQDALQFFNMGLQSGRNVGDLAIVLSGFLGLAAFAIHRGQTKRCAWLLGAADTLMRRSGYTLWNATRKMHEEILQRLALESDQAMIEKEKKAGSVSTLEEAITFALSE